MASKGHGTLYTGVTSNLPKRALEHREGLVGGFTAKYGCKTLVWYELHETMIEAITREKQIKAGSRAKKLALIEAVNPEWKDLSESLISVIASGAKQSISQRRKHGLLRRCAPRNDGLMTTCSYSPRYAFRTSGLPLISLAAPCISTRPVCRM
jgi:predicted GIY-YIG superfamily endonuclease